MMVVFNVINLKKRSDRWEQISSLFKNTKIRLKRFNAISHDEGWIGCTLSHISLIESAKNNKDEFVIVMEDDTILFDDILLFEKKINKIISHLTFNINKWDIFQFGITYSINGINDDVRCVDKKLGIIEYQYGQTTNFIIYNKSVYDKMIKIKDSLKILKEDTIDIKMNKLGFRMWTILPFMSYQKDGYSDIQIKECSYKQSFLNNQEYLKSKIKK